MVKRPSLCDCRRSKPPEWSIEKALTDPEFFEKYDAGDVAFQSYDNGKSVYGFAKYIPLEERHRDLVAQKEAGGDDRRPTDQGGDLLAISMGGISISENLTPMQSKLNQGEYKSLELDLISKLKAGDDLYVEISSLNNDEQSERPDIFTYNWVSRDGEGKLDYGCETFLNEHPDDTIEEEVDPAEFDEVMERIKKEIDPIGPEWLEGKDFAPELLEDLAEQEGLAVEIDKAAIEAIATEFDDME